MSKAIEGIGLLAAAAGLLILPIGGLAAFGTILEVAEGLAATGVAMEAGAIAAALTSNRGANITTRQPAAYRQIIYGEQRVGGIIVYQSTTGSKHDQYNFIIVFSGHPIDAFVNLYLDGRQVVFTGSGVGNTTRNGVNFGGNADGNSHTGPNGVQYNFGGLVYAEACFGDQTNVANTTPGGGYNTGLNANDPTWAPTAQGLPYLGGCAYLYVKIEYDPTMFPNAPEIKATIRGKNNIYDPRTGTVGYTNNWALIAADIFADTQFGLGDASVSMTQLAAAANVCDEAVALATGGTEARYTCNTHYDSSTGPGAAISSVMPAAAGRYTRAGGQWYLWPAYWQGPSFSFNEGSLAAEFTWKEFRDRRDLFNRATGVYTAPNYPYNATAADGSNLYDSNGFYEGEIQDNFGFAWQPTSIPYFAEDTLHGFAADQYRLADAGSPAAYSSSTTYSAGANVLVGAVIYTSLRDGNTGNTPGAALAAGTPANWSANGGLLARDFDLRTVCSISQAQRVLKINLERNRQQGSSTLMMFPSAFQMQQIDVMNLSFAKLGWTNKQLEVVSVSLGMAQGKNGVPTPQVKVGVQETAPSVYEWSTAEELGIYLNEVAPQQSYVPVAPTNFVLASSAATAVVGADGVVEPRVLASWNEPLDGLVQQIELGMQGPIVSGSAAPGWIPAGIVSVESTYSFIRGVVAGQVYNFRIRSLRANGAASPWLEVDSVTVGLTLSSVGSKGLNPNSPYNVGNNAIVDSIVESSAATIRIYGPGGDGSSFTRYVGATPVTMSAAHITGQAFTTTYYIVYDTGASVYLGKTNYNDTLADQYIFIGSVVTCASTYTGTGGGGSGGGGGTGGGGSAGGGGSSPGGGRTPSPSGDSGA